MHTNILYIYIPPLSNANKEQTKKTEPRQHAFPSLPPLPPPLTTSIHLTAHVSLSLLSLSRELWLLETLSGYFISVSPVSNQPTTVLDRTNGKNPTSIDLIWFDGWMHECGKGIKKGSQGQREYGKKSNNNKVYVEAWKTKKRNYCIDLKNVGLA